MKSAKTSVLLLIIIVLTSICGCGGGSGSGSSNSSDISDAEEKPEDSAAGTLQPPDWKVGDTWTVETEVFDQGRVMPGSTPSWTAKQAWRFEVVDIKSSSKYQQYILDIKPSDGNRCPYWFKFWLRSPDLFVCSYEIFYQEDSDDSDGAPAPHRKYTAGDGSSLYFFEYFKNRFPTFPIDLLPNFDSAGEDDRSRAEPPQPTDEIRQRVVVIPGAPPADLLERSLLERSLATRGASGQPEQYYQVTLEHNDFSETQYWKEGLPWPFFGHRIGGGSVEKRFRLTDFQR